MGNGKVNIIAATSSLTFLGITYTSAAEISILVMPACGEAPHDLNRD